MATFKVSIQMFTIYSRQATSVSSADYPWIFSIWGRPGSCFLLLLRMFRRSWPTKHKKYIEQFEQQFSEDGGFHVLRSALTWYGHRVPPRTWDNIQKDWQELKAASLKARRAWEDTDEDAKHLTRRRDRAQEDMQENAEIDEDLAELDKELCAAKAKQVGNCYSPNSACTGGVLTSFQEKLTCGRPEPVLRSTSNESLHS